MGKKSNAKRAGSNKSGPRRLLPQTRSELSSVVDEVFKRCTKVPSAVTPSPAQEWTEYTELYALVEKIRAYESELVLPKYKRMDEVSAFMVWLQEKGVQVDGVTIADYGAEGLGLQTEKDIPQGHPVITVPVHAMMTEETAKKSYLGSLIERDPILQHMGNVSLALHLLGEAVNPDSKWAPYIHVLPESYSTTLYYTPEQMQLLKGSPALEEALKMFRNISRQYSYFYRILQSLQEAKSWPIRDFFTFDSYRWAVSSVMTRQNLISSKESSGQLALIPAWDMANHQQGIYSTDFDDEKRQSVCLAQKDFKAGEQFTIFYGQRSNFELFIHNGFVYADNENNHLSIKLGVSKSDPLHDEKNQLLQSLGLPSSGTFHLVRGLHPITRGLLAFTRVFCMDKDSLQKWVKDGSKAQGLLHEDCDVGTTIQDKTWAFLSTRVALLTRAYPTTLEEDEEAVVSLQEPESTIRNLLLCEKKILRDASIFLKARVCKQ
ncbi:actin-histidine N-methyltransferase-like [Oratosquilla oratoria]|uniref:actin-histidine N-methyltransferase-like n=1 Tax=Oratosquilla oratoria TaxID=337810 RepID=UPI003F763CBF